MTALQNARDDLKSITRKITQGHIDQIQTLIDNSQSREELAAKLDQAPNVSAQLIMAHIVMNIAESLGKYRGGTPTLADQILDQQVSKVKRYRNKAYRLSEKQLAVIVNDYWDWLKNAGT